MPLPLTAAPRRCRRDWWMGSAAAAGLRAMATEQSPAPAIALAAPSLANRVKRAERVM